MHLDLICVIFFKEQSFLQCELEWLGVLLMGMRVHLHNNNCKPKNLLKMHHHGQM